MLSLVGFGVMPKGVWERPSPEVRFWAKVQKTDGCWNWVGGKRRVKRLYYGVFGITHSYHNYETVPAHRFSYELTRGAIPEDKELDHVCRNSLCVNPDHLEAVSHKVNMQRSSWALKTHCPKGHPLSGDNLAPYELKLGHRKCVICKQERRQNFHERTGR